MSPDRQASTAANTLDIESGSGIIEFSCDELGLKPGIYQIDLTIERYPNIVDWRTRCATLRVDPGKLMRAIPHAEAAGAGWKTPRDRRCHGRSSEYK